MEFTAPVRLPLDAQNSQIRRIMRHMVVLQQLGAGKIVQMLTLTGVLGIESKMGEIFLSLQYKDKVEGGGLKILHVKIAICKLISMPMPNKWHFPHHYLM